MKTLLAASFMLALSPPLSLAQGILLQDAFDRPASRNIAAALTGVTQNLAPALPSSSFYLQPFLDPANTMANGFGIQDGVGTNGGGAAIVSNQLQLAIGAGTSNAVVDHNFTDASILEAGGFSVSLDVASFSQNGNAFGAAFAIGMSSVEALSCMDAFSGAPRMTGGFGSAIGSTVSGDSVSDFWVALRGDNTLAWGSAGGVVNGTAGLAAKTGTITGRFRVTDFNAGSLVHYEVLLDGVPQGSGNFVWSGTGENYVGIDARDSTFVVLDNLTISTFEPAPVLALEVSNGYVLSDQAAKTVTLSGTAIGLPAGATFEISADQSVSFPNGGNTGLIDDGSFEVNAVVDGTVGDTVFTFRVYDAGGGLLAATQSTVRQIPPPSDRPNVIVMLFDDLGWSDLGCYGSEIPTPNMDALASTGVRFRNFYNSARCSPTRCSILTGLYPQQAAVDPAAPLPDLRNDNNVTIGELLEADGYGTYMAGKWHLGPGALLPENRGFQQVWRMSDGRANNTNQWRQDLYTLVSRNQEIAFRDYTANGEPFYQTTAIGDYAVDFIDHNLTQGDGAPFAMYLAFGAPHFPIQAPAETADEFMSVYQQGWDVIRQERYDRQLAMGVTDRRYPFPALGGVGPHQAEPIVAIPPWDSLPADRRADLVRRMALYAAMIKHLDDNVGKVVEHLRETGRLDNTLIFLVSDNGANHERGVFGTVDAGPLTGDALTNMGQPSVADGIHYGGGWAHVSNTPLKLFKHFTHEGGIRAPMIAHWPAGFAVQNTWVEQPTHLVDLVATIADVTGAPYPTSFNGHPVLPLEGASLMPLLEQSSIPERSLYVEHESNRMMRRGKWKLVTENFTAFDGEFTAHERLLYDMENDPGESTNLAAENPALVVQMVDEWNAWASRVGLPAGRLMVPPPENLTPPSLPVDLFLDTFNRPNATDLDSVATGISGNRVGPIGANAAWFEGYEGSGTATSIQVQDGLLQMAVGFGMSETGVMHNFVGQDLVDAGGFSISLKVAQINSDASDAANRYAGFGVGLNVSEATGGNDIGSANPRSIRGSTSNPGSADAFLELDLEGNVKWWTGGVLRATVPVGVTRGTLTAAFQCSSFSAGSSVTVTAFLDGREIDLNPSGAGTTGSFAWSELEANFVALSARATTSVLLDNFAVRRLPISDALALNYGLRNGLEGSEGQLAANPDGDGLNNFGEWAFGTDPNQSDDALASTTLILEEKTVRFAHRRLEGSLNDGSIYQYFISEDLQNWEEAFPSEEATAPLDHSPGYEVVTLALPTSATEGRSKLFLRVVASTP